MMKKNIYLLLIAFIFTSCLEMKQREYLKDLEDFTYQMDSLTDAYNQLSLDKADNLAISRRALFNNYVAFTQNVDTIDIMTAQNFENISYSIKNLDEFITYHNNISNDLKQKTKEIKQLDYIVKNGYGNRSDYDSLINNEKKNIKTLKQNVLSAIHYYNEGMQDFDESVRYIQNLIEE